MRILVLSDSHGDVPSLKLAINSEKTASVIVFLGDGLNDFEKISPLFPGKKLVAVRGNCDSTFSPYPEKSIEIFEGINVYCSHGYSEKVKFGLETLKNKAREENAKIALFGHTHTPHTSYENGLYLLNPGSVRQNSCGIVEITNQGIMCFFKKIIS